MYVPSAFAEQRIEVLHDFMDQNDFATLVSNGPAGVVATHLPVLMKRDRGGRGALQLHFARQNDHWQQVAAEREVLTIFHGPHGYISPAWYETKIAVPTWNYIAVHAYGTPMMLNDDE